MKWATFLEQRANKAKSQNINFKKIIDHEDVKIIQHRSSMGFS